MWNFNKIGRIVEETVIQRGLTVRLTKVWPWKREEVSEKFKYLVTVTNPQGIEVYNHSHSHKVLFGYVRDMYLNQRKPEEVFLDETDVSVLSFSSETLVESYLETLLAKDGVYLVMVPSSLEAARKFWKEKFGHPDSERECYAINVTAHADIAGLVAESFARSPGRYYLMVIKDGFVQSTVVLT